MAQKGGSPSLSTEQLQTLAKVMYHKGAQAIHTMKFRSEYERAQYLKSCRDTYFHTQDLLNTTNSTIDEFKDDNRMAPIVKQYAGYIKTGIVFAYKSIQMYSQRAVYIEKLHQHASTILKVLREHKLSPFNEARLSQLKENINLLSNIMHKYESHAASLDARKFSRVARAYGYTLQKLIQRSQAILRFNGRFQRLGAEQQLQVLDEMIESTGGRKLIKYGKKAMEVVDEYGGTAVLALTALTSVVDVYSADPDKRDEIAIKNLLTVELGELQGFLYVEVAWALISTGNPYLIAGGVTIGIVTYYFGNTIQDYINKNVTEADADELLLSTELPFHPLLNILRILGVMSDDQIVRYLKQGRPGDSAKSEPPPPISTFGLRVRGPEVPDGRVLALQIASKA